MRAASLVALSRIRRRWAGLLLLGVLAGVIGGLATGAVAGESRTDSAAERLITATAAPDAFVFIRSPDDIDLARTTVEQHPETLAVWPLTQFIGRTSDAKDWYYPLAGPERGTDIYRPLITEGRLPADDAIDEVLISAATAANTGLGVGDVIRMDLYTPEQMEHIARDTEVPPAGGHLDLDVVGISRDAFDISTAASDRLMVGSPAFYRRYTSGTNNEFKGFAVRAVDGAAGMEKILASLRQTLPPGVVDAQSLEQAVSANAPASRVLRIGTWLLALIVVAIGSFVLAQAIRRHIGSEVSEEETLRAIGFTRVDGTAAATVPSVVSAIGASFVALAVAIAMSPVFPVGRPRLLEPSPGVSVNIGVLVVGALLTAAGTIALFAAMAWLDLRQRRRAHRREPSRLLTSAATVAPPPILLGLHLTTDPSRTHRGVSARTAIIGTAIGVAGLVASVTFSHSLEHVVTTPAVFGLDFDLTIEVPETGIDQRLAELASDPELSAVAEQYEAELVVDGEPTTGVSMNSTKGSIQPLVVSGRLPAGPDEIALGPALTRRLGLHIGESVELGPGDSAGRVTVVGEILDPRVTSAAYAAAAFMRPETLEQAALPEKPYPILVVRYGSGVDPSSKTAELDKQYPYGVMDESFPSVPGALRNLDDVRPVPTVLAWFFAGLTVVALVNGIVVTGRRARRPLGIVRGLGFTSSQVRRTVLTTACAMAVIAVVVGLPLGMVLGATTWSQVSSRVDISPDVQWPLVVCLLVLPVSALLAAAASLWPAHAATAPHPSEILRVD